MSFEFDKLLGVYRGTPHLVYTDYTQPVYSYDQENWYRIEDVRYDSASHTFGFSHAFVNDDVWIAYAHPYPYDRSASFVDSIESNSYVKVEELALSPEGRPIELLTITDPEKSNELKKTVVIIGLQHAGEDAGAYMIEGLIQFLLSDVAEAILAREKFMYKIVIMMNPDGIYNGTSRYNINMEDLNNIWLNDSLAQPEVTGVKNWKERWYSSGNTIDLFLDVHNHSQFHTNNVVILMDHQLDSLIRDMNKYWPVRGWHSGFKGSSDGFFHTAGIPSGTVELSQSYVEEGKYLNIEDYHSYGKGTVLGIMDFFNKKKD